MHTIRWRDSPDETAFECSACRRRYEDEMSCMVDGARVCMDCMEARYGALLKCHTPGCDRFGTEAELLGNRCDACRAQPADDGVAAMRESDDVDARSDDGIEIGSADNAALVQAVCDGVAADLVAGRTVAPWRQAIRDIDQLVMEANSGASFEQYFRWAAPAEIARVATALRDTGLQDVADLVQQAIAVAFPDGLPASAAAMDAATEWTPAQEQALSKAFQSLEPMNGRITNVLAGHIRRQQAT